ncbi:MAG: hypothetical protein IH857_06845 [Deltaproteobacteria bacterium]|nr:hypothetical protein [Deltaproteobacteria bacterium]
MSRTLASLKATSPPIRTLAVLADDFGEFLKDCEKEKSTLAFIRSLHAGLISYVSKEFDDAIKKFEKLDQTRSLTHQLLGSALYELAHRLKGDEQKRVQERAIAHLDIASDYVVFEAAGADMAKALLLTNCRPHIANKTPAANRAALKCLTKIVERGLADYNTYFNIGFKHLRLEEYKLAIQNFKKSADHGGDRVIRQTEITESKDLVKKIMESIYGEHFQKVLQRFRP